MSDLLGMRHHPDDCDCRYCTPPRYRVVCITRGSRKDWFVVNHENVPVTVHMTETDAQTTADRLNKSEAAS